MYRDVHTIRVFIGAALLGCVLSAVSAAAQQAPPKQPAASGNGSVPKPATPPADYVIGPNDILTIIVYGQDPQLHSGDVLVRPDGKITRLLIDEVQAAGLTPAQLKAELTKAYSRFFQDPVILVTPKEIRSRVVYITGQVAKPGEYLLNEQMDLLTLITKAGGLLEFANKDQILLIRKDPLPNGRPDRVEFNYNKLFETNSVIKIPELRPGDRVVVR